MGWKDAFSYLRRHEAQDTREDTDLPLGARIGSLLQIQQTPLIRAQSQGSLLQPPAALEHARITAISRLRLPLEGQLYRYYLDTDKECFLQLYTDASGAVSELLFCTQLTRLIPETADEQDCFTGAAGSGLGDHSYTLWRWQLEDFGFDLDAVFGAGEQIVYQREAGQPDQQWIAPFRGKEIRIDDAAGTTGLQQDLVFMPYARALADGGKESLLISTEILGSVNGNRQRGIHVDFTIGIPVEPERLQIQ